MFVCVRFDATVRSMGYFFFRCCFHYFFFAAVVAVFASSGTSYWCLPCNSYIAHTHTVPFCITFQTDDIHTHTFEVWNVYTKAPAISIQCMSFILSISKFVHEFVFDLQKRPKVLMATHTYVCNSVAHFMYLSTFHSNILHLIAHAPSNT